MKKRLCRDGKMKVRDYGSRYRFCDVNRLTCQMKCRLALLQLRQKFTGEAMNLARVVNPGVDGGNGPPPQKKSGAKRLFLEITIIFLERKKSLVSGLEPNYSFLSEAADSAIYAISLIAIFFQRNVLLLY